MFSSSVVVFALVAFSANLVAAAQPACLLAAVNTEPNPADLGAICGPDASKVQAQIKSLCGTNTGAAMSAFSSICSSAGHHTATPTLAPVAMMPSSALDTAKVTITSGTSTLNPPKGLPTTLLLATGGPPPVHSNMTGSMPMPTAPGATGSGSPGYQSAAGRVDAESFAALALAAAGLAIFL